MQLTVSLLLKQLQFVGMTGLENVQVQAVCLISQCMADQARWEDGLKHCEAAMSVLPSATHLPLSLWKVGDLAH